MAGRQKWGGAGEIAARWGLVAPFDPGLSVRAAPALWRREVASQLVSLVPVAADFPGGAGLPSAPALARHVGAGGIDLVLDMGGVRHRLHVAAGDSGAGFAALVPPLGDALRVAACDAARRLLGQCAIGDAAAALRPSALQRRRLALLLAVHDAWAAGASNREIGLGLVYPWLAGTDALAWKGMSERRRVQRLVAEARALVAGGYRALLRA